MPKRCVIGGCGNTSHKDGISLHFLPSTEPLRTSWIDRIKKSKKEGWPGPCGPAKETVVCSVHFVEDDFVRLIGRFYEQYGFQPLKRKNLKRDAIPSLYVETIATPQKAAVPKFTKSVKSVKYSKQRKKVGRPPKPKEDGDAINGVVPTLVFEIIEEVDSIEECDNDDRVQTPIGEEESPCDINDQIEVHVQNTSQDCELMQTQSLPLEPSSEFSETTQAEHSQEEMLFTMNETKQAMFDSGKRILEICDALQAKSASEETVGSTSHIMLITSTSEKQLVEHSGTIPASEGSPSSVGRTKHAESVTENPSERIQGVCLPQDMLSDRMQLEYEEQCEVSNRTEAPSVPDEMPSECGPKHFLPIDVPSIAEFDNPKPVTIMNIMKAADRLASHIITTPVFSSALANEISGRKIFFKAENLQKTGSFKIRGALNSILAMKERGETVEGYVTHSTGNHGLAVALASKLTNHCCSIVVPHDAPKNKIADIRDTGAEVIFCEPNPTSRVAMCAVIENERKYYHIPSYDYPDVIAGQGTIALELLDQVPDLDAILVSVSGGGLISGISIAAKAIHPDIKVFAVEPKGKELEKSLKAGRRLWPNPPQFLNTIADAIRTQPVGHLTWPIILEHVEKEVFSVTDDEMIEGMKFSMSRLKLVIEAAAGAAVAAALSEQIKKLDKSIKKIGVILCGGNVDIDRLPWSKDNP